MKESDIEGHLRNISTKLFENLPTSFFGFVAMETGILHGSQKFEGILVRSSRGCFLFSFIPIDPLVTEEKKLTDNGQRTPDAGQKAITITHLEQSSGELKTSKQKL